MRFRLLLILALPALLLPASAHAAGRYVDKNHGFKIKVAPGWSQTPTQPGETTEVAKFKDDRKGDFAELSIYRFASARSATVTPTDEGGTGAESEDAHELPPGFARPVTRHFGRAYASATSCWGVCRPTTTWRPAPRLRRSAAASVAAVRWRSGRPSE